MSLLIDSLEFISREFLLAESEPSRAIENITRRAMQLRTYARGCSENQTISQTIDEADVESRSNLDPGDDDIREESDKPVTMPPYCQMENVNFAGLPPIPNFPGVDSDMLKNLLMSWFYAGYYTAKSEVSLVSKT